MVSALFGVRTLRAFVYVGNALLTLCSVALVMITAFATVIPPKSGLYPEPVSEHPQYSAALIFLYTTSISVFGLSMLGIFSLLVYSSFFLSIYILGLMMQLCAEAILCIFAIANRKQIHVRMFTTWSNHTKGAISSNGECSTSNCEIAVTSLKQFESRIFIIIITFVVFQMLITILNCTYCEYLSRKERYEAIERDNNEEDETMINR
ncbi:hypothetical protein AB6A40_004366 [Gnathostoma spinigerum]|uniref:Uncharacterized protein n=1 Tax=Gnathostoma spinigerum TaxID=75299 RepID=A0ABD6ELR5_9BILA